MPPTSAPLEEPDTETMSRPRASSASITPIWAKPRAPPAPRTRATFSPRRARALGASAMPGSALVVGQRELQQRARLFAQRGRLGDLGVAAVMQHVHQQLARVAVGHLEFVAAVGQVAALLL